MHARYFFALWLFACLLWLALWLAALPWPTLWPLAILAAWLTADAGSYAFHVFLDHHLRAEESSMAKGFQDHHHDPLDITREPIPEVLSSVAPLVLPIWLLLASAAAAGWLGPWLALYVCVLGIGVGFGQIFHRWSHLQEPSRLIRALQRARLIVAQADHDEHHRPPHGTRYAIVSGWVNPLFDAWGVDRLIDRLATRAGFPRVA